MVICFLVFATAISKGFNNYIEQNKYLKSASYVIPKITN